MKITILNMQRNAGNRSILVYLVQRYWRDAVLFLIPVSIALSHDIHRFFLTSPDGDLPYVATALRMNSGLEQLYSGHTGYTLFLLLSWWFKLMHVLGIVSTSTLEGLPPPLSDAFAPAFRDLVFAARYFIAIVAGLFAVIFYRFCQALTGQQTVAFLVAMVFAFSRPLCKAAMMVFTELPSSLFLFCAFVVIAVPGHKARPLLRVFLVGFFVTLAAMAKMQSVGYTLAFVVLALGFGPHSGGTVWPVARGPERWLRNLVALAIVIPAAHMIATSVLWNTIDGASHNGWYHFIIAAFTVAMIFLWGRIYGVPSALRMDAVLMLALGIAVAWYGHLIQHTLAITEHLANFLDHLYFLSSFARFETEGDVAVSGLFKIEAVFRRAWRALGELLSNRFVIEDARTQALEMLTVPVLIGGFWLLYRREFKLSVMVLLLIGMSLGTELFTRLYQFNPKAHLYHTPWLLIAAALIGAYCYPKLQGFKRTVAITLCCSFIALTGWGSLLPDLVNNQDIRRAYGEALGYAPSLAEGFKRIVTQHGAGQ